MSKRLKRFYTSQIIKSHGATITLSKEESHHLKKVLRLQVGDTCLVFDPAGNEWIGSVCSLSEKNLAQIKLAAPTKVTGSKKFRLTIAQAIPQRAKMNILVQKAAELEVDFVIPMITDRTMVRMNKENESKVSSRWAKIVQEARKQSGSTVPTQVLKSSSFHSVLENIREPKRSYLFHPEAGESIAEVVIKLRSEVSQGSMLDIIALIGPEGGFTDEECKLAREKGLRLVRLGKIILKVDTAFVSIASAFQFGLR